MFLPRTSEIIKNTTILQIDQPDILCWKLTLNGKCNYKSTYTACLQVLVEEGMPAPAPVCNQVKNHLEAGVEVKRHDPPSENFHVENFAESYSVG
jgi:hypothetical protein